MDLKERERVFKTVDERITRLIMLYGTLSDSIWYAQAKEYIEDMIRDLEYAKDIKDGMNGGKK